MKSFMINIDAFLEGLVKKWTVYKETGSKKMSEEDKRKFKMPNCDNKFYEPVFLLQSPPTREFAISIRKNISDAMKEKYNKKKAEQDQPSYEEQIACAIALLKATGEYVIQKRVVTVTLEDV